MSLAYDWFYLLGADAALWQVSLCALLLAIYLAAAACVLRTDVLAFAARGLDTGDSTHLVARVFLHLPYWARLGLAAVPAVGVTWAWWRNSVRRASRLRTPRHDDNAPQKYV